MANKPLLLTIELITGPPTGTGASPWRAEPGEVLTIGRGQDVLLQLPDASVSRRHAEIREARGEWILKDLGSRHGTGLNEGIVESGTEQGIADGDLLRIGPWIFRVRLGAGTIDDRTFTDSSVGRGGRVRRVLPTEMGTLVKRRLDLVLGAAERLGVTSTESEIARTIVDTVLSAGGSTRAALVRVNGENLEVLASGGSGDGFFELSRSLIDEASRGEIVLLESDQPSAGFGQSIIQLGIHSAFCAPVRVGNRVEAVLYLDARGGEAKALEDSVAFVGALARICGLALANLSRASLERHRAQLEADLGAARVAQRIMMPPAAGQIGPVRFAVVSKPGRFVAGDLIGIEPRADGRVCVYIGDVTGKGAGAAMLMGIAQSYLSAALASGASIEDAVNGLNRMIAPRIEIGQFISLWIGEFDAATGVLRSVDAGHGYAMLRSADGAVRTEFGDGSFPLGIEAGERYPVGETTVAPGDCLLLFSDGLVEQADPSGRQFGTERILACLEAEGQPGALLSVLEGRLTEFGGSDHFDDDLTIAAFCFGR